MCYDVPVYTKNANSYAKTYAAKVESELNDKFSNYAKKTLKV